MTDETQDLAAVEAILTERDALQGWLARLDASSGTAPEAVRARVRTDYQHRLDAVVSRLQGHTEAVLSRLNADRQEFTDLSARAQLSRDAVAEAELRHAVGEFDQARFEQERSRHIGDLETFELSLAAVAERVSRMEAIQLLINRPTAPDSGPESAPPPRPLQLEQPVAAAVPTPVVEPITLDPTLAESEPAKSEEDAFLAVFDAVEAELPAPVRPPEQRGGLSFTPTGEFEAPRSAGIPPGSPPLGMPERDQKPRFVRPSPTRGSELAEAEDREHGTRGQLAAALDVGTVELQPDPVLPEPAVDTGPRTLRCGECGAMNRPLEWYCEKCGAELTAG